MILRNYIYLLSLVFTIACISCYGNDHKISTCDDGEISTADAVWSHGEGDLQNTKRASGIRQKGCINGPRTTPQVQWSFDLGGPGTEASPVIGDDGTIYIVGEYPGQPIGVGIRNAGLFAVTPEGSMKWYFRRDLDIGDVGVAAVYTRSVAIGKDGTVYFGCWDSTLYALNPSDGSMKWKYKSTYIGSPVVDNAGNIYTTNDTVFCFSSTGTVKWRFVNDPPIPNTSLSLGRNAIYSASFGNGVLALDYTGNKKWLFPVNYQNDGGKDRIVIDEDDNLYLKTNSSNIKSISRNGNLRWEGSVSLPGGMSQPVLRGDYLYFGAFDAVYRLDKTTGQNAEIIGVVPNGAYISQSTSPLIDDSGVVYIATRGSTSFNPFLVACHSSGQNVWTKEVIEANGTSFHGYLSLSANGIIYFATSNYFQDRISRLYAIH